MAGEREKCLSFGMSDYISKPVRESELFRIINNLLYKNGIPKPADTAAGDGYQVLNLDYLKELSGGDTTFERNMIEQFAQQMPEELNQMATCLNQNDAGSLVVVAHNMKTTVSFMGLHEKLSGPLDFIESNALLTGITPAIREKVSQVEQVCLQALHDTEKWLAS